MTTGEWIEYWAVYVERNDRVYSKEFASEFDAHQHKKYINSLLENADVNDARLWIQHGHYE